MDETKKVLLWHQNINDKLITITGFEYRNLLSKITKYCKEAKILRKTILKEKEAETWNLKKTLKI